jgi:hypothetical protein
MKRQIPGLHLNQRGVENRLEGLFLVRVETARYRWHPQKPFVEVCFVVLEPKPFDGRLFSGRLYCTERALWKLNGFFEILGMTRNCSKMTRSMKKRSPIFVESSEPLVQP